MSIATLSNSYNNLNLIRNMAIYYICLCSETSLNSHTNPNKELNMHAINEDECTGCGACPEECPEEAISEKSPLGSPLYVIDGDKCSDCGACVDACPVDAISAQ